MSRDEEVRRLSLVEVAARIRTQDLSPVEVAEAALAQVQALNADLMAFCTIEPEQVLAQARRAEAAVASGDTLGPLHGVPIAVKDLIFTKDLVTTGGSTYYRDFLPAEDDVTVERLRAAGAVILGKTNVPEFGFGPGTKNPLFGVTRNPWDLSKTPGGSSGGSAVAVLTEMCPGALGSDGGGSVRIPASFCGIYGLKASFGRVPLYPGCRDTRFPGFSGWESLEHIGPLTRTVDDAALMLDVLAGPDPRDRHSLPREAEPFFEPGAADVKGLRVAWTTDFGGYARADEPVRLAVEAAARQFQALGAHVENATPFRESPAAAFSAFVALDSDPVAMREMAAADPSSVNPRIAGMLQRTWTFEELASAGARRRDLYNEVWRFFAQYDLLLTPTMPVVAYDHTVSVPETIAGQSLEDPSNLTWFTHPFNLTGNPAASIPCGFTPDGLPIGLQIVGGHLADRLVLRASRAYERAAPWLERRPPL